MYVRRKFRSEGRAIIVWVFSNDWKRLLTLITVITKRQVMLIRSSQMKRLILIVKEESLEAQEEHPLERNLSQISLGLLETITSIK